MTQLYKNKITGEIMDLEGAMVLIDEHRRYYPEYYSNNPTDEKVLNSSFERI